MTQLSLPFTAKPHAPHQYTNQQREKWVEKYMSGQSFRQIAAAEGVPYPTVSWYITKTRGIKDGRKTGRPKKYAGLDRSEVTRQASLRNKYGVSLEWYEETLASQGGVCAICKQPPNEYANQHNSRVLNVDHCHDTGGVRALLCMGCNLGISKFCDSPKLLRAAAAYLEEHGK